MAWVARTVVTLRFFGEDLDPDHVTERLGAPPTDSRRKGQSRQLLAGLTDDVSVWRDLSARYDGSVMIGLFMQESNEMTELSASSISLLAARGLRILFDIYDPIKAGASAAGGAEV